MFKTETAWLDTNQQPIKNLVTNPVRNHFAWYEFIFIFMYFKLPYILKQPTQSVITSHDMNSYSYSCISNYLTFRNKSLSQFCLIFLDAYFFRHKPIRHVKPCFSWCHFPYGGHSFPPTGSNPEWIEYLWYITSHTWFLPKISVGR